MISCGENANISDAVRLSLWPLSLIPLGCVCIRTARGLMFPLSCGPCTLENRIDQLWSTEQNIKRSNVRITVCSPCWSPCRWILPHTATSKNAFVLSEQPQWRSCMCLCCTVGDFTVDSSNLFQWARELPLQAAYLYLMCCLLCLSLSEFPPHRTHLCSFHWPFAMTTTLWRCGSNRQRGRGTWLRKTLRKS